MLSLILLFSIVAKLSKVTARPPPTPSGAVLGHRGVLEGELAVGHRDAATVEHRGVVTDRRLVQRRGAPDIEHAAAEAERLVVGDLALVDPDRAAVDVIGEDPAAPLEMPPPPMIPVLSLTFDSSTWSTPALKMPPPKKKAVLCATVVLLSRCCRSWPARRRCRRTGCRATRCPGSPRDRRAAPAPRPVGEPGLLDQRHHRRTGPHRLRLRVRLGHWRPWWQPRPSPLRVWCAAAAWLWASPPPWPLPGVVLRCALLGRGAAWPAPWPLPASPPVARPRWSGPGSSTAPRPSPGRRPRGLKGLATLDAQALEGEVPAGADVEDTEVVGRGLATDGRCAHP